MAIQTVDFFTIRTLTNLHAGSGDTTYGIVDNMVQRDPASKIPIVHASSLKGALRQYFTEIADKDEEDLITAAAQKNIQHIFGGDSFPRNKGASGDDFSAGSHLFLEAKLLVLPVRSDKMQFFRVVCPELVQDMMDQWKHFGYEPDPYVRYAFSLLAGKVQNNELKPTHGNPIVLVKRTMEGGFCIEDWEISDDQIKVIDANFDPKKDGNSIGLLENAEGLFGENLVVLHIQDFKSLCEKLPVIARNQLENGISQNLFYEEVVPRESKFFSFVVRPFGDNSFASKMNNTRIQVGGNATIGYGQCKFFRFPSHPKAEKQSSPKPE